MKTTPKTIQIFLPHGDPQGIRVAEVTTRTVRAIDMPRKLLPEFARMKESKQVGVYFLFGASDEDERESVYIGQTGDLGKRLVRHDAKKEFWKKAIVIVSRTDSLTQTHALFLEWHCLQVSREADRYANANGNSGSQPHTPAPLEAECLEIFETAKTLMGTLGYPMFDPLIIHSSVDDVNETFYCTASGANGTGRFTSEGFVVLKRSVGRKATTAKMQGGTADQRRQRHLKGAGVIDLGDTIEFARDYLFDSPSMAAFALSGRSANGWKAWKNKAGKTLDEVKRQ